MIFIDTHTHIYDEKFDSDRDAAVQRAYEVGILKMILPGIDSKYTGRQKKTTAEFPEICKIAYGLHPTSVKENFETEIELTEKLLRSEKSYAVGEIGIDLYWDKTFINQQIKAFEFQVSLAKELNLPVIIHVREAFDEVFKVIDKLNDSKLKGVFHSFAGNSRQAEKIIEYSGFKLGINGILTYKNSNLPEILKKIDISNLVIETDSPYLPPIPHRGKRNEPAFMIFTAQKLTEIYNINITELSDILLTNTIKLFPDILD
jgi:TatD DNase family protein